MSVESSVQTLRIQLSMFPALSIAAGGLAAQSQKLAGAASAIAALGSTPTPSPASGTGSTQPVRIGALPIGDPLEAAVTMKEAELAYRFNAAVLATASDMIETLLDVLDPRDARR